ncbi:SUKH-4 family immunity protein [Streptomyces sp. NPDC002215]|uniref:SUKH-4 family immunity protein n=1 Tax=Streptomyces sp. NPDC002215 TaxID=3154412 RepID=UPI0033292739
MNQPLPQLTEPEYTVIHVGSSSAVPAHIAADLQEIGVPSGMIGYEYWPLSEAGFLSGIGECGLVAFGASGLFGRVGIDVATRHVVHIPDLESATTSHVNRDLASFHRCVAAVIACFPFYGEDEEERWQETADEIRELVSVLDESALLHDGFWETFCDDVAMGDYADGDV